MPVDPLFPSFFIGGFECSTHRLASGRRLDMVAATGHDRHVAADYQRLLAHGIRTAREGIRWHLIESTPGRFDFSGVVPILRAAREAGIQVVWDLLHYGWPDGLDIWGPEFIDRFARLAREFAGVLAEEWPGVAWIAPVNEVSYLSWMGGEVARINPFGRGRGHELKDHLVRASIAATRAVRGVLPSARFAQVEPIFHVIAHPDRPGEAEAAEAYRRAQFEVWDKLSGRLTPELGGRPEYLDVIGVNYYPWNQWIFEGEQAEGTGIGPDHPGYRPFRDMLMENFDRYRRPLFVAETGTEGDARAGWLAHVGEEVRAAIRAGCPLAGLCLYPIMSFPGWDNGRDCRNGLWELPDEDGHRPIHEPLAIELHRQALLIRPLAIHANVPAGGPPPGVRVGP